MVPADLRPALLPQVAVAGRTRGYPGIHTKCELAVALLREQARIIKGKHFAVFDGGYALESVVRPLVLPKLRASDRIPHPLAVQCPAVRLCPWPLEQGPRGSWDPQPKWRATGSRPTGGMWNAKRRVGHAFAARRPAGRSVGKGDHPACGRKLELGGEVKAIVASVEGYRERFTWPPRGRESTGLQMVEARFHGAVPAGGRVPRPEARWGCEECRLCTGEPDRVRPVRRQWVTMKLCGDGDSGGGVTGEGGAALPWNKKRDRPSVLDGPRSTAAALGPNPAISPKREEPRELPRETRHEREKVLSGRPYATASSERSQISRRTSTTTSAGCALRFRP